MAVFKIRKRMIFFEKPFCKEMFFPFMVGVYPFSNATKKQKEAMKNAGMDFDETGAYDLIYAFLIKLFK